MKKQAGKDLVFKLTFFLAQANGVTIAYILTQLNVVIATLGAIFILHEKKTPYQMCATYIGLALIVEASIITVFSINIFIR